MEAVVDPLHGMTLQMGVVGPLHGMTLQGPQATQALFFFCFLVGCAV